MSKEIPIHLLTDIKRSFQITLNGNTTPVFLVSETKEENGRRYDLNWLTEEVYLDNYPTARQREVLEIFVKLANEILNGNVKPRVRYYKENPLLNAEKL